MDVSADINVLREMVRLAENRRSEALDTTERMDKYNLALIAFAGSFLSLLLSVDISISILQISGANLIVAILISLFAVRPQRILGGSPDITEDIIFMKQQKR